VVLADGRIMHLLSKLKKDNTGYDLRHIFVGAEARSASSRRGAEIVSAPARGGDHLHRCPSPAPRQAAQSGARAPRGTVTSFELIIRE